MKFNEILKHLITTKGCTQSEFAQSIGVKPNTVSDWLNKGTSPNIKYIYLIVKYFNVSFDYLFTGVNSAKKTLSKEEEELIQYFRTLTEKDQYRELGRLSIIADLNKKEV